MANTGNPETDKLDFVEIEIVKKGLLGRKIALREGFSQEIFRNGEHIGSVVRQEVALFGDPTKQNLSMDVRGGDSVVLVNLGVRSLVWEDGMLTEDGYTQRYRAELQIQVGEPTCFAQRCLHRSDPVHMARIAIHNALLSYARRTMHDAIKQNMLYYQAENTLVSSIGRSMDDNRVTGLRVLSASVQNFVDPRRASVLEGAQLALLKEEELRIKEFQAQQRERELRLEEQQRNLELNTQTRIKTWEIQSSTHIQKTDVQAKADLQRLNAALEQEKLREKAEFEREEEAKKREAGRQEEARRKEAERQEEMRNSQAEREELVR